MPGFLTFARGGFMIDFVVVAMLAVLPALSFSIYVVKIRKNYRLHRQIQLWLGAILAIAVVGFEVDIRLHGWQHLAKASPYFDSLVFPALNIHLVCAISTLFSWIFTIWSALRHYPDPVRPTAYSSTHKKWAWFSTIGMFSTTITGWIFYYLAFVAT